ncbi:MAG: hypothetical protein MUD12_02410 [Spirochaetes bacterium]|jgi:hypothetical protein|nr:hypothetical protein [Spirochaetota bacterium]
MVDTPNLDVSKALDEIGEAVLAAISYKLYPTERLDEIIKIIDQIISTPSYLAICENYLKSSGSDYVLFFLSNIIYNLKKPGELALTPDVLKWLGSVWKNFLKRNKSYQDLFPLFDEYKMRFRKYYPGGGTFVNQITNVNQVKDDFIPDDGDPDAENSPIKSLEKFYQVSAEILGWMKPTYFFLIDYYNEQRINTGKNIPEAILLEKNGIPKFGFGGYSYLNIAVLNCQALGIIEAVYLILKKKKGARKLITIDGKQRFLTPPDIYVLYLEKFNAMKKELKSISK